MGQVNALYLDNYNRPEAETLYFVWLVDLINPLYLQDEYWELLTELHTIPFVWDIERDVNRAIDGIELRREFEESERMSLGDKDASSCSVLEMIIGLAMRMDGLSEEEDLPNYFWEIIGNLDLIHLVDDGYFEMDGPALVHQNIGRMMARDFPPNGRGGMFPLAQDGKNQNEAEIWYQMQAYLIEDYYEEEDEL